MRRAPLVCALATVAVVASADDAPVTTWDYRGDRTGVVHTVVPRRPWERVVWEADIGGAAKASPARLGDALYVTAEPDHLVAVDLETGALRWDRSVTALDALPPEEVARLQPELDAAPTLEADLRDRRRRLGQAIRELRSSAPTVTAAQVAALSHEVDVLAARLDAIAPFRVPRTDDPIGYAAGTPATDGHAVYVSFANGVAASFLPDGTRRWVRWFGPVGLTHRGYSGPDAASPIVVGELVIVSLGGLRALDAATGTTRWSTDAYPHYGTPAVAKVGDRPVLALPDGRVLDAATGVELARGLGSLCYTSPYALGDRVWYVGSDVEYSSDAINEARAWQLVPDGTGGRAVALWDVDVPTRDRVYGEPVLVDHTLFAVTRNRQLIALDADTGSLLQLKSLGDDGGEVWASPTVANGTLWVPDITGHIYGVDTRAPYALVATMAVSPNASAPLFLSNGAVWRGERTLVRHAGH